MSNGFILQETADHVAIVTGTKRASANVKTGPMLQIWFLVRDVSPLAAMASGRDSVVCFDCPMRGDGTGKERGCNVELGKAVEAVWQCHQRGGYPVLDLEDYPTVFAGAETRLGAYGEPSLLTADKLASICQLSARHTGYTHQWRNLGAPYRHHLQASCNTRDDVVLALALGWSVYGMTRDEAAARAMGLRRCPYPAVTCAKCKLCAGILANPKTAGVYTLPASGTPASAPTIDQTEVKPMTTMQAEALESAMLEAAARDAIKAAQARDRRRALRAAAVGSFNASIGGAR